MPTPRSAQPSEDAIREQAYFLWEKDGRPPGRATEYWQLAIEVMGAKPKTAKATSNGAANGKAAKAAPSKPAKAAKPEKAAKASVSKPAKAAGKAEAPVAKPKPSKAKNA